MSTVLLWFMSLALLGGLFLVVTALRGRRGGDVPFCRKCNYNLTGVRLDNCPECGVAISEKSLVWGERCVLRRRLLVGALVLCATVPYVTSAALTRLARYDWYAAAPNSALLFCTPYLSASAATEAIGELSGRLRAKKLSKSEISRFADLCLKEQERPELRIGAGHVAIQMLDDMLCQNLLSATQQNSYLQSQIRDIKLEVRSVISEGMDCPVRIVGHFRSPSTNAFAVRAVRSEYYSGQSPGRYAHVLFVNAHGCNVLRDGYECVPLGGLGEREIRCDVKFEFLPLFTWRSGGMSIAKPPDIKKTLTAYTTIVAAVEYTPVLRKHSDALDRAVARLVTLRSIDARSSAAGGHRFDVTLRVAAPRPIGYAFEASVLLDGEEIACGDVLVARTDRSGEEGLPVVGRPLRPIRGVRTLFRPQPPDTPTAVLRTFSFRSDQAPERIKIILKGTAPAAARAVDDEPVWDGELHFDVQITKWRDRLVYGGEPLNGKIVRP